MTQGQNDRPQGHSLTAKVFHWGFIVVFLYALSKGLDNPNQLADTALLNFEIVFASAFLALLGARFVYMRRTRPTAMPETTPKSMKMMARAGHLAMYISIAMIAISGLLIGAVFSLWGPNGVAMDAMVGLHEFSLMATYLTIGLHVSAALFHRLKGDGIWSAMVPIWKETDASGQ